MARNEEELEEWYQEMREEALEDERYEYNMRNDYEHFLYQFDSELCELQDIVKFLKDKHEHYGWEFDLSSLL